MTKSKSNRRLIALVDAHSAASRRGQRELDRVLAGARCPAAERILANNQPEPFRHGMTGLAQMVLSTTDPRTIKRQISKSIISMRENRAVLAMQGKGIAAQRRAANYYLNRIAFMRSHLDLGE